MDTSTPTRTMPAHALKPGDVITIDGRAVEVFDAYPVGAGRFVVKITHPATGRLETRAFPEARSVELCA